jgi:hypothetical protein
MRNADVYRGAGIAGSLLVAMPIVDVLLGGGVAGAVHATVGGFGLLMVAISAAAGVRSR